MSDHGSVDESTATESLANGSTSAALPSSESAVKSVQGDDHLENPVPQKGESISPDRARADVDAPPLPVEGVPPLPNEAPPATAADDGWQPVWDESAQAFYFYNRFSGASQWTNPRVPDAPSLAPGVGSYDRLPDQGVVSGETRQRLHGGYDPAIHGDYDPNADYAQESQEAEEAVAQPADPNALYTATGTFNRFTGKWQAATLAPENFNDENKSRRQMNAFFDVDAAANSHDGKSLKAERSGKKLTKQELKAFKEKRKERKEEKRRAWLRD